MKNRELRNVMNSRKVFALPYIAWIAIFTAAPLILILLYAFTETGSGGVMVLTAENLARAFSPLYMTVFWRSVRTVSYTHLTRDFNAMTDAVQDKMYDLENTARQREDFVASFAHELKTPLTSIIGYADMLLSLIHI